VVIASQQEAEGPLWWIMIDLIDAMSYLPRGSYLQPTLCADDPKLRESVA